MSWSGYDSDSDDIDDMELNDPYHDHHNPKGKLAPIRLYHSLEVRLKNRPVVQNKVHHIIRNAHKKHKKAEVQLAKYFNRTIFSKTPYAVKFIGSPHDWKQHDLKHDSKHHPQNIEYAIIKKTNEPNKKNLLEFQLRRRKNGNWKVVIKKGGRALHRRNKLKKIEVPRKYLLKIFDNNEKLIRQCNQFIHWLNIVNEHSGDMHKYRKQIITLNKNRDSFEDYFNEKFFDNRQVVEKGENRNEYNIRHYNFFKRILGFGHVPFTFKRTRGRWKANVVHVVVHGKQINLKPTRSRMIPQQQQQEQEQKEEGEYKIVLPEDDDDDNLYKQFYMNGISPEEYHAFELLIQDLAHNGHNYNKTNEGITKHINITDIGTANLDTIVSWHCLHFRKSGAQIVFQIDAGETTRTITFHDVLKGAGKTHISHADDHTDDGTTDDDKSYDEGSTTGGSTASTTDEEASYDDGSTTDEASYDDGSTTDEASYDDGSTTGAGRSYMMA